MPAMQQFKSETEGARSSATQFRMLLAIPPSFFATSMGLAGLAGVWTLAGEFYHLPAAIGDALYVVEAAVYLPLLVAFAMRFVSTGGRRLLPASGRLPFRMLPSPQTRTVAPLPERWAPMACIRRRRRLLSRAALAQVIDTLRTVFAHNAL